MEGNYPEVIIRGRNYPGANCPGVIFLEAISWGAIVLEPSEIDFNFLNNISRILIG